MKFAVPFLLVPHYYYSHSRLSGLFRVVPMSPDNRGLTVYLTYRRAFCLCVELPM